MNRETESMEHHINYIVENATMKVIPKEILVTETYKNITLDTLKKVINSNTYDTKLLNQHQKKELKRYLKMKEEICCSND